ncbi:unnamed protein product [Rotaria sp. Silwood2]|nr:unnamed protein product [Rotaria sp. Silwood2]CAF4360503.1 unnamed protein product [Rotaria sp. Silwood2]
MGSFYKSKISYCVKLTYQNRQTTINNKTSSYTTYASSAGETLQSSNSPCNLSVNQRSKKSSKNSNLGHMSRPVDHRNLPLPHMQSQDIHLHHRMLSQPDSMSRHVNPHQPGNLPPPHSHIEMHQFQLQELAGIGISASLLRTAKVNCCVWNL